MDLFLPVLATIILIEAITNIISKSELFEPLRKFLFEYKGKRLFRIMHTIIDCPYCLSVWSSFFCIGMLYLFVLNLLPMILVLFFLGIILHRVSNIAHHLIDLIYFHRRDN